MSRAWSQPEMHVQREKKQSLKTSKYTRASQATHLTPAPGLTSNSPADFYWKLLMVGLIPPLGTSGKWALSLDYGPPKNGSLVSQAPHRSTEFLLLLDVELRSSLPLLHSRTDMSTPAHAGQFLRTSLLTVSTAKVLTLLLDIDELFKPVVYQVGLAPPR